MRTILKAGLAASTLTLAFLAAAQSAAPAHPNTSTAMPATQAAPAAAAPAAAAPADLEFAQKHPRIHEVNERLRAERERVQADFKSGKISADEAKMLMKKARKIHHEELRDAIKNDGHLTKAEQEKLNHEENRLAEEIHEKASEGKGEKHQK